MPVNRLALCTALLLLLALSADASLDINIPPGTPLEWGFPTRPPTGTPSRADPSRERDATSGVSQPKDKSKGSTERGPDSPPVKADPSAERPLPWAPVLRQTPLEYARVTTPDIISELAWTAYPSRPVPGTTRRDKRRKKPGPFGDKTRAPYPPRIGIDLHWLTMAVFVRRALHPNQILDNEALAYLLQAGPPARAIAERLARSEDRIAIYLGDWIRVLLEGIPVLPGNRPRVLRDKEDPHRDLMLRLAGEELASGYAYAIDGQLGAYLTALPRELAISLLAAYAIPKAHPLLQQNSVALLARYEDEAATEALFAALIKEKLDPVARRRALLALARRGVKAILPIARRLVKTGAPPARALGLHCLRGAGEREDQKLVLACLSSKRFDTVVTAVRTLAALRDQDRAKSLAELNSLLGRVKGLCGYTLHFAKPDTPDGVNSREPLLRAHIDIALTLLGDEPAAMRLRKKIKESPPARIGVINTAPIARGSTFGRIPTAAVPFLITALPALDSFGRNRLRIILDDRICEPALRLAALRLLVKLKILKPQQVQELLKDEDPRIAAAALLALARLDPKTGIAEAIALLQSFPGRRKKKAPISRAAEESQVRKAIAALRVLEDSGELTRRPLLLASVYEKTELRRPRKTRRQAGLAAYVIEAPLDFAIPLIKALGAIASLGGEDVLAAHLAKPKLRARGQAALQLIGSQNKAAFESLLLGLKDKDPWLRLCAYHALRRISGLPELDVDWLEGSESARQKARAAVKAWIAARPKDDP